MKMMVAYATSFLLMGTAFASGVTPIQKVIQLMEDMVAKGTAAKEEEATKFAAFDSWCTNTESSKTTEIKEGDQKIESLNAAIEKAAASIRSLTDRIYELDEDVARWKKDEKSATEIREKESTDFKATVKDYTESIEALTGAIAVLKKQAFDRTQAELVQSLLQVRSSRMVPMQTKTALMAFLQQDQPDQAAASTPDDMLFREAPEANAYEFQSGGIVDMLAKLKDEFSTKKSELEAEEMEAQHGFEMIMQQLADEIENANHEISKKSVLKSQTEEAKAGYEGDLATTTEERDEDQKYLDETKALCGQKKTDFEARQKLRADELTAVNKAIEIMSSGDVSGSGDKHLPSLLQLRKERGSVLAQLRADQSNPLQARIAAFLAERAERSGSRLLAMVSEQVASDPFKTVKKMIKDLIIKLMEEATSETEHKGWCDTELTTNKQTRDSKTEDINKLNEEIDDLTAEIMQLTTDIANLAAGIKELETAMAEETAERTEAKEKNTQTIEDAKVAQTAVTNAIGVLKDFYEKSAQATALAQQSPGEDAPETFSKSYKGMLPEGGSVVDMLEVILSDFARLESETSADEAQQTDEYDKFMFESKKDAALKANEKKLKSGTKTDRESALHSTQEELKATQGELDKAMAYYEKLKPTCVESGITYEDRVKKREEEIVSLQEALKILSGEDI